MRVCSAKWLLLTSCVVVPSVIAFLPQERQSTARHHHGFSLRSQPNQPGDWFESESADIAGGRSLRPQQNDPFVSTPEGRRANQAQAQMPITTSPFGWNGGGSTEEGVRPQQGQGQGQGKAYYPSSSQSSKSRKPVLPNSGRVPKTRAEAMRGERRPNTPQRGGAERPRSPPPPPPAAAARGFEEVPPSSPYQEWKRGDNREGSSYYVAAEAPQQSQAQAQTQPQQSRQSQTMSMDQQPERTPYKDWKMGDNWESTGAPRQQPREANKRQSQSQQSQQPTQPFEGYLTRSFSSTPDQPGAWFNSNDSQAPPAPQPKQTRQQQTTRRAEPFERGYAYDNKKSTPDEPWAFATEAPPPPGFGKDPNDVWRQRRQEQKKQDRAPNMYVDPFGSSRKDPPPENTKPSIQKEPAAAKANRKPNIPKSGPAKYQFTPKQTLDFSKSNTQKPGPGQTTRKPNIPKPANAGRQPTAASERKEPRKPIIPQTPRAGQQKSTINESQVRKQREQRQPTSLPKEDQPAANPQEPLGSVPFQIEEETQFSTPTPLQPGVLREQEQVQFQRPTAFRERDPEPPGGYPQRPPPQPPRGPVATATPTSIEAWEPFNMGGPLGPAASYSKDAPMYGSGGGSSYSRNGYGVGDEVIQGAGSRKTWATGHHDQTILEVGSEGRPVFAQAQVWQGPGNTPASMSLYSEDGGFRPWRAAFQNTGRSGASSVMDVRNTGPMEFPVAASVVGKHDGTKGMTKRQKEAVEQMEQQPGYDYKPSEFKITQVVQGQSLKYFNVKAGVRAVMVELSSEGRPMFVQVEMWQGPSSTKQAAEIYSDNGSDRHWSAVIDTHGRECTIAVRNTGPGLVYPIKASVDPIF